MYRKVLASFHQHLMAEAPYDHFSLDANQSDPIFLASLNPEPTDFSYSAISPKVGVSARLTDVVTVHAQYAGGFRAPPYSAINTGFTNPQGGYVTLPNPELRAETSDNIEVGVRTAFDRASFGVTVFSNRYDDFIDLTTIGFNPRTRLLEFQSRNLEKAEIKGVALRGEAYVTDSVMIRGSYAELTVSGSRRTSPSRLLRSRRRLVPSRRTKACSVSSTSNPPAVGVRSCRSGWSSPTRVPLMKTSSRRTPTRSSTW